MFIYRISFIKKIVNQTRNARNKILLMKIKIEINLLFIIILLTIGR